MNVLNRSIQDKRQTVEYINTILENETLTQEQKQKLVEQKERCEFEIQEALKILQK